VNRVSQERRHSLLHALPTPGRLAGVLVVLLLVAGVPAPVTAAQTPQPGKHSSLPKTPEEREKALSDLYALLATADSEESAKAIADSIERVWLFSGSPTVDLLMQRALKAIGDKKLDLALTLLNHVVEQAPDFAEGWNQRAYVHFARNDLGRALGDLRRVLALDPNHFNSIDVFARILREIGQKKAALSAYRRLLDVYPFWPGARQAVDELSREVEGQGI
jgi:tetratricopeptide (TPR) repeat protein